MNEEDQVDENVDRFELVPEEEFVRRAYNNFSNTYDDANGLPRHNDYEKRVEFARFLEQVRKEAVEEYKANQTHIVVDRSPETQIVYVTTPCPRCGS